MSTILLFGSLLVPQAANAGSCTITTLVPQLRGVTIGQGLGSYPALVRGKDTLVRLYLSRPVCATDSGSAQTISLTGAALDVKIGGALVHTVAAPTNILNPAPQLVRSDQAPANDATSDPLWVVPTSATNPLPADITATATFEARLTYTTSLSAVPTTIRFATFGGSAISKTIEKQTEPLKILAIPMGNPSVDSPQLSQAAKTAALGGLSGVARIFPVANGSGNLGSPTTAGIRYLLDELSLVDVSDFMSGGVFCGTAGNFPTVASRLAGFYQQYNLANSIDKAADRVLGVIDEAISSGCAEGMAGVGSRESWVRARTSASITAAVMGMELAHNDGAVPCGATSTFTTAAECPVDRDDPSGAYHSSRTGADATDPNRGYNVSSRQWLGVGGPLGDDKTVMRFQSTGWNNNTTLLEKADWELVLCRRGGPITSDCTLPVETTASAMASVPVTVLSATTDGTAGGTEVFDSFSAPGPRRTKPSDYRFVQRVGVGGPILGTHNVPVFHSHSIHDEGSGGGTGADSTDVLVGAFPTEQDATRWELWSGPADQAGSVLLAARNETGVPTFEMTATPQTTCCIPTPPPPPTDIPSEAVEGPPPFAPIATRITFEGRPAGTEIDNEYEGSGVTFVNDATTTPVINAEQHDTSAGNVDVATHSEPNSLFNSADTVTPGSAGVPLTMNFTRPMEKIGMYIGNDDFENVNATLTVFDSEGTALGSTSRSNFGPEVQTFIGLDAHAPIIAKATLDYGATTLAEEIDDLLFQGTVKRITFDPEEGRTPGEEINTQYKDSLGVEFVDPDDVTPVIQVPEDCQEGCTPTDTDTPPHALFHRGDVFPSGYEKPLTIKFDKPAGVEGAAGAYAVGMFIGNQDQHGGLVADARALDAAGAPLNTIEGQPFGTPVTTFVQLNGVANSGLDPGIRTVELEYYEPGVDNTYSEEIDTLWFEVATPPPPPPPVSSTTYDVELTTTSPHPSPELLRAAYFSKCPSFNVPLAVGVEPDPESLTDLEPGVTFSYEFDASRACQTSSATVMARVNNGYETSSFQEETVDAPPQAPPTATISSPVEGGEILEHEALSLKGEGYDREDGDLTGGQLRWTSNLPGFPSTAPTGNNVDVPAPAGGWTPGIYTATLEATDSAGNVGQATANFTIVTDNDNDGVPATKEACSGGSDNDPSDSFGDFDNDGVPNFDDDDPCVAASTTEATGDFDPNTLNVPSTGSDVTMTIRFRYRNPRDVNGSTVRITEVGGVTVNFQNTGWSVKTKGGVVNGVAKFDRQALIQFLDNHDMLNQHVLITVEGASKLAVTPSFAFKVQDSTFVQEK